MALNFGPDLVLRMHGAPGSPVGWSSVSAASPAPQKAPPRPAPSMERLEADAFSECAAILQTKERNRVDWSYSKEDTNSAIVTASQEVVKDLTATELRELVRGMVEASIRKRMGWP